MYCDFSRGLELVSASALIPHDPLGEPFRNNVSGASSVDMSSVLMRPSRRDAQRSAGPLEPPERWRGSLLDLEVVFFEIFNAGAWQDRAPGETRVHIAYPRLITFYDPS